MTRLLKHDDLKLTLKLNFLFYIITFFIFIFYFFNHIHGTLFKYTFKWPFIKLILYYLYVHFKKYIFTFKNRSTLQVHIQYN